MATYKEILAKVLGTIGEPKEAQATMFDERGLRLDMLRAERFTDEDDEADEFGDGKRLDNIFASFNNERLIEETYDGTHYVSDWNGKKNRRMTDREFESALNWRLGRLCLQTGMEVGFAQSITNRFQRYDSGFYIGEEKDTEGYRIHKANTDMPMHTQFDRMIYEECNMVNYKIRTVQLRTGDQTPSMYRPEEIMHWAKCTFQEAVKLVECYRVIEPSFEMVRMLNKAAAKRDKGLHPALATVTTWNDPTAIQARVNKFKPEMQHLARRSRAGIRDIAKSMNDEDFDLHFPETTMTIIDLARECKRANVYEPEDPHKEAVAKYEEMKAHPEIFGDIESNPFITAPIEKTWNSDVTPWLGDETYVYFNSKEEWDAYNEDDYEDEHDGENRFNGEEDDRLDSARDSEAFGYWFDSVIPINKALAGGNVPFYLRACKALTQATCQRHLNNLRKHIFDMDTGWNYHQTKDFWTRYKATQRQIRSAERRKATA